jgi:hypothetical protein
MPLAASCSWHCFADPTLLLCCCPTQPQDKRRPGDFAKAEGLTIIPPEAEVANNPLTAFQKFFSPESLGSMFGGSS